MIQWCNQGRRSALELLGRIMEKTKCNRVEITAAVSGWILRINNGVPEVFVRWESLVTALEMALTSKGDKDS